MRKLRIAQIAPLVERVPPKKYGGTERIVHALTEELVKRGHDVTLFATADSITSAKLMPVYPRSLREAKVETNIWSLLQVSIAYKMQDQFDIIHDHTNMISLPTAQLSTTPTVITLHGAIDPLNKSLYENIDNVHFVSISESQTSHAPRVKVADTIYNGLNMDNYPTHNGEKDYLLVVGRICMEKGVHYAIDVAEALDMPLIIAAKLEKKNLEYFNTYIKPRLYEDRVTWIGEVSGEKRNELMAGAKAFLHPVVFREPFGLTMIESMACGTPVIAFNKGSIPEVVKENVSGFVVEDTDEMIDAVLKVDRLNRQKIREYAIKNFSDKKMTDEYEKFYYRVLAQDTIHSIRRLFMGAPAN